MAAIGGGTEEPEGTIVGTESAEQQDRAAIPLVMPVAQTGRAVRSRGGLALPVNEASTDRVVAVPGGRREAAAALVEREREQLGVGRFRLVDAALPCRDLGARTQPECGEDLDPGVPRVDLQRAVGMRGERCV